MRGALILVGVLLAAQTCLAQQADFDGLWGSSTDPSVVVTASPGVYLLASAQDYSLGVVRPSVNNLTLDVYGRLGNYTVLLSPDGNTAQGISYFNSTAKLQSLRRRTAHPQSSPNFEGAYESEDGWMAVCLRSKNEGCAYLCLRNKQVDPRMRTVATVWGPVIQRGSVAEAYTLDGAETYSLSADQAILTITTPANTSLKLTRLSLPLEASAPPLTGLFKSNPASFILGCGSPENTRAVDICVGVAILPFTGSSYTFIGSERQSANGLTTDQIISVGTYSSVWADQGQIKRQYLYKQVDVEAQPVALLYRTDALQTLRGTHVLVGVEITCSGEGDSITCFGTGDTNGTLATLNMAARSQGLGLYRVNLLYQSRDKTARFVGPLSVSPDGTLLTFNTSQIVYY